MRKYLSVFVVLSIVMLTVAGCGGSAATPVSVPDAQAGVCAALATLKTAVAQLGTITAGHDDRASADDAEVCPTQPSKASRRRPRLCRKPRLMV